MTTYCVRASQTYQCWLMPARESRGAAPARIALLAATNTTAYIAAGEPRNVQNGKCRLWGRPMHRLPRTGCCDVKRENAAQAVLHFPSVWVVLSETDILTLPRTKRDVLRY